MLSNGVTPLVVLHESNLGLAGLGLLQRGIPARQHEIQLFGIRGKIMPDESDGPLDVILHIGRWAVRKSA